MTAYTTYLITYTIRDGNNEYGQSWPEQFSSVPTEQDVVLAIARRYEGDLTKEQEAEILAEYTGIFTDQFTVPNDYRVISDVQWEQT
jgi:hypothetical protein